jgi:hypothetical protein
MHLYENKLTIKQLAHAHFYTIRHKIVYFFYHMRYDIMKGTVLS